MEIYICDKKWKFIYATKMEIYICDKNRNLCSYVTKMEI